MKLRVPDLAATEKSNRQSIAVPEAWMVVTQALLVANREPFYTAVIVTSTLAMIFATQVGEKYERCKYDARHRREIDRMANAIIWRICASHRSKLDVMTMRSIAKRTIG